MSAAPAASPPTCAHQATPSGEFLITCQACTSTQNPSTQNASIAFDTSVYGLGFGVEAGRVGYKISPYIYQRPDTTPYFANDRWDNGEWSMDGAIFGFSFGTAKLTMFGGRKSNQQSGSGSNGSVNVQPMFADLETPGLYYSYATGDGGGRVVSVVIGPKVKRGYRSTLFYQHQNTLKTLMKALGVSSFPGAAGGAASMSDFFY